MKYLAILVVVAVVGSSSVGAETKPNILVIFADDLGYADLGCQGSKDVKTPNIDSLASNGVRCTAGYVTAPQCSPSRAGLISGRYQQRFGHEDNGTKPVMLMNGGKTIGDQLKPAGYATAHFGKWHLGFEDQAAAPQELVKKGDWMSPKQHGFDESYGYHDLAAETRNPNKKKQPHLNPDDRVFAKKTVDFIDRHKGQPWCVYLAFHAPHGPHTRLPEFRKQFRDASKDRVGVLAAMAMQDEAVGLVLKKLRELKMEGNTLIFYISDNGGLNFTLGNKKEAERDPQGSFNTPFRGGKGTVMEGGIRIPFIVQWTDQIPAGKTYDRPVISLDVIPTALAAANAKPLPRYDLDGVNLLPFLQGKATGDPHDVLFWRWRTELAIRVGDWKLEKSPRKIGYNNWRLINLATDPGEKTDLSAKEPERFKTMLAQWTKWNAAHPPVGLNFKDDDK